MDEARCPREQSFQMAPTLTARARQWHADRVKVKRICQCQRLASTKSILAPGLQADKLSWNAVVDAVVDAVVYASVGSNEGGYG